MGDALIKIFTHFLAASGGYILGKKTVPPPGGHKNLFSRFIPTVIFAAGIAYFAINAPKEVTHYGETVSNNNMRLLLQKDSNETRLKDKALDMGFDIYGTKNQQYDSLKEECNSLKSKADFYTQSKIGRAHV